MLLGVVYKDFSGHELVRDLRRWKASGDWVADQFMDDVVVQHGSLQDANAWHAADTDARMLLAVGYGCDDLAALSPRPRTVAPCRARSERKVVLFNSQKAQKTAPRCLSCGSHPVYALREVLLGKHLKDLGEVRILKEPEELKAYFRLRYKVWSSSGFMPKERDPRRSRLEIEYSDRRAIPIGFMTHGGHLAGCARLVRNFGKEYDHYIDRIRMLIDGEDDRVLRNNFTRPAVPISQPFDLLGHFPDFQPYYQKLVRDTFVSDRPMDVREVSRVIVDEAYRGQRIGELLVYQLIARARKKGTTKLLLACQQDLIPMYGNCGFRQVQGMHAIKFGDIPVPSYIMELDL